MVDKEKMLYFTRQRLIFVLGSSQFQLMTPKNVAHFYSVVHILGIFDNAWFPQISETDRWHVAWYIIFWKVFDDSIFQLKFASHASFLKVDCLNTWVKKCQKKLWNFLRPKICSTFLDSSFKLFGKFSSYHSWRNLLFYLF